jgi:hypothetical protein
MIKSVFFHIPKAAGTSVKDGFYHAYSYPESLKVWPVLHGGDIEVQDLSTYQLQPDNNIKCVMGHFNLQEFRANKLLMEDFMIHGNFTLACVRDPFERLISDYNYILNTPTHDRRDEVLKKTLQAYTEEHPSNEQARWLDVASINNSVIQFGTDDKVTRRIVIVGSSKVDSILPRLLSRYTERKVEIGRENVGAQLNKGEKLIPSINFKKINALDYALYDLLESNGGVYVGSEVCKF